jgi:hypothetical protein
MGDKTKTYRITGPEEITNSEKIKEMFELIHQSGILVIDNSDPGAEKLEVQDGPKFKEIDYLFLSAQNIDHIEVTYELVPGE